MTALSSKDPSEEHSSGRIEAVDAEAKVLSGLHILSVDDNRDSLEITAFTLELAGANVTSVSSGEQALQSLGQLVPDVIISDVGMPDMDGYRLIKKIRSLPVGKGGALKAIALTAYAQESDRQTLLESGFQDYLVKPVDPDVLVATVRKLVGECGSVG